MCIYLFKNVFYLSIYLYVCDVILEPLDSAESIRSEVPYHNAIVLLGFSIIFSAQNMMETVYNNRKQQQGVL